MTSSKFWAYEIIVSGIFLWPEGGEKPCLPQRLLEGGPCGDQWRLGQEGSTGGLGEKCHFSAVVRAGVGHAALRIIKAIDVEA